MRSFSGGVRRGRRFARAGESGTTVVARSALIGALAALCVGTPALLPTGLAPAGADAPDCRAASVQPVLPASTPLDFAENLGFDAHGNLWVSRVFRNVVQRYDSAGRVTAEVAIDAPGAIRLGPDGALYVVYGDSSAGLLQGAHGSGIVRFDPDADGPVPQPFVTGLGMANGAAFDDAGDLYVADTAHGVVRVRRDGSIDPEWTGGATADGANGIAYHGDSIYVTLYRSATGRIVRIPLGAPRAQTTIAEVTLGALPLTALPDDLTVGSDGMLYDATTTGRVVRIDPAGGGEICTVADLGVPVTSVVTVPGDERSLLVSTATGAVLRIR
ncbi:SMP-30/gluconolactonase/LRE family protein [Nocardia veterana]|uniref:Sugar lactone lactonase YvrE n=1 Tax=Nocardia veterana TaxID=132249 RepID=A0A7X6M2D8_9NOCA|nr:SMP-30/gluconolactonase/LRE family protein [Nocardia veterana]NKY89038.1 hypothetical protein [Nocardia veterana]